MRIAASNTPAARGVVRRNNLGLLVTQLSGAPASRTELAERTGLIKATVSSLVDTLIERDILIEGAPESDVDGRLSKPVSLNPDGPVAVGIEISVDYMAACVVDLTGRVRSYRHVAVDNRGRSPSEVYEHAAELSRQVRIQLMQPLFGIGLALPGVVSPAGELLRAPNLPRLAGDRPGEIIGLSHGISDVLVENEANLGAMACLRYAPAAGKDFVFVSGEVGVGAGLVFGGELFRGVNGFAGELGHVVVERQGASCGCGGRGCVEQYAGQDVLLRASHQRDLPGLYAAVARRERRALAAVEQAGAALGVGLSSLLNVFDLPVVVLSGTYAELFDAITPALSAELSRRVLSSRHSSGQIRRSQLGVDAAVRGAAGAVIDRGLRDSSRLKNLPSARGA